MLALYKYGFEIRAVCLHQPVCLSVAQCVYLSVACQVCMYVYACLCVAQVCWCGVVPAGLSCVGSVWWSLVGNDSGYVRFPSG